MDKVGEFLSSIGKNVVLAWLMATVVTIGAVGVQEYRIGKLEQFADKGDRVTSKDLELYNYRLGRLEGKVDAIYQAIIEPSVSNISYDSLDNWRNRYHLISTREDGIPEGPGIPESE